MKYLSKCKKALISATSFLSLGIFYPIAIFAPKAMWAMGLMSFDDADPDDVDKILSFSANGISFLIPLIVMMFIIIVCGLVGTYFIVKGKSKFEKRWGWMTVIAGGFGFPAIYALITTFVGKKAKRRAPTNSKVLRTGALVVTPVIAIAPIVGIALYHAGPDQATHVNGVQLAKAHKMIKLADGSSKEVPSGKTNVIELFTDGLDPNWGLPILKKDKDLKDFEVFDHFVAPGGETSYSLPLEINGLRDYNEFTARFRRSGHTATMMEKNIEGELGAFHGLFSDMAKPAKAGGNSTSYTKQYLLNSTSMGGGTYMQAVSGYPDLVNKAMQTPVKDEINGGPDLMDKVDVSVVNWEQTREDLAGKFGVSHYSPDNAFFGWFNKESTASATNEPAHVYLREGLTHSPRNTAPDGSVSYWTGTNSDGKDLTLVNATQAEINSVGDTIQHLKDIDAYDNSLIVVYGDHANHKTPLAHPTNDKTDGDKYHSVAMIKYPNQVNTETASDKKDVPMLSTLGFYGGDLPKVIKHFKDNQDDTYDSVFKGNLDNMFDLSTGHDKLYATFYKDHIGYFKFNGVPETGYAPWHTADSLKLVSKDEPQVTAIKKVTIDKGLNASKPGWLTYAEFERYVQSLPAFVKSTDANPHASEPALQKGLDDLFLNGGIN